MEFVIGMIFGFAIGYVVWHVIPKNKTPKAAPKP